MDKNELISIVIPVYNSERYIAQTIENLLDQTYKNYEIILIDDCSTDKSREIIQKYIGKNIKLLELTENVGPAEARNIGIKNSNGNFICFQDSDDLWNRDKLYKQLNFMKNMQCEFSFTGYEFTNKDGTVNGKKVNVPASLTYDQALKNTIISTITVMIDLNKISKRDIFMPNVKSEDTATWWKILKKGYVAYGLNETLSYYRRGTSTLSSNKIEAIKRVWNLYRNVEKISLFKSIECFLFYAFNTVKKRI